MAPQRPPPTRDFRYTTMTGYFKQDEASTDAETFDYTSANFGLLNREYETDEAYDPEHNKTQWQRFQYHVSQLNTRSEPGLQYKVLYLARHGEGFHNVAEALYGTEEWDRYWSLQSGDATSTWVDAHLTPRGVMQAKDAHEFWKNELEVHKIPAPERYYVSPLYRCLETANVTFSGLELPHQYPFVPEIKELLREVIGIHTCDQRSSRTYIHANFPLYTIEPGFAETDELWKPDQRETDSEMDARLKTLLDDICSKDQNTYLSLTSHSGAIASILRVVGHRPFRLLTGSAIPVLVKIESIP